MLKQGLFMHFKILRAINIKRFRLGYPKLPWGTFGEQKFNAKETISGDQLSKLSSIVVHTLPPYQHIKIVAFYSAL